MISEIIFIKASITGAETVIIITFPANSIFEAIDDSPASLQS